jgi:hypothetical protein
MPTIYESALNAVSENKHVLVNQFQFKKLERSSGLQWWNVRNLKTGTDQKISDSGRLYTSLREPANNKLIWADTLQEQSQAEKDADYVAGQAQETARFQNRRNSSALANDSSVRVAGSAPQPGDLVVPAATIEIVEAATVVASSKPSRKINREYNLCQQQSILSEVVFGQHSNKKGEKISPFKRNDHGNNGHFFDSVVAALNGQADGPFKEARAVKDTVKLFVEAAINTRKTYLENKFGGNYMKRNDWDVYDYSSDAEENGDSEQTKDVRISKQKHAIDEMLDSLVYCAFDTEEGPAQPPPTPAYTEADDEAVAAKANGGSSATKRQRQFMESVRPKSHSAVAQIQTKQEDLSTIMQSIASMLAVPTLSPAPVPMQASPATQAPAFDEELVPLLEALKKLAPGTTTVCRTLAMSLGNYGILSVEELRAMANANDILKELNWTPLQIQKVLNPVQNL